MALSGQAVNRVFDFALVCKLKLFDIVAFSSCLCMCLYTSIMSVLSLLNVSVVSSNLFNRSIYRRFFEAFHPFSGSSLYSPSLSQVYMFLVLKTLLFRWLKLNFLQFFSYCSSNFNYESIMTQRSFSSKTCSSFDAIENIFVNS